MHKVRWCKNNYLCLYEMRKIGSFNIITIISFHMSKFEEGTTMDVCALKLVHNI